MATILSRSFLERKKPNNFGSHDLELVCSLPNMPSRLPHRVKRRDCCLMTIGRLSLGQEHKDEHCFTYYDRCMLSSDTSHITELKYP